MEPAGKKFVEDLIAQFGAFYTAHERERCAKIAERHAANTSDGEGEVYIARKIADEIRQP